MSWLNIPHQLQIEDSWCLPACAAMVSAYWEQPLYQGDLARWLKTTVIGTPARNIGLLQAYGFEVTYQEGSYEFLNEHFRQGIPCITFLRTGGLSYWDVDTPHAVVLAGIEGERVSCSIRPLPLLHKWSILSRLCWLGRMPITQWRRSFPPSKQK